MGELLRNQEGLEKLNLNMRSWGFNNNKITDEGMADFFEGLTNCKTLKFLTLGLRGFAYNNDDSVTAKSIEVLIEKLPNLTELEELDLNVEVWRNEGVTYNSQIWKDLNCCLNKMPKLQKRDIIH